MNILRSIAFLTIFYIGIPYLVFSQEFPNFYDQDFQEEYKKLELACYGGDAWVCYEVGKMYQNGSGLIKNQSRAKQFYSRACSFGILEACNSLEFGEAMNDF